MEKIRQVTANIVDTLFYIVYVLLVIVTILDLFGVNIPFVESYAGDANALLKFLLLVFATIGIIVLNDKRSLQKQVLNPIKEMNELLNMGGVSDTRLFYFKNKKEDYAFFSKKLRELSAGAEVLVTSFDKSDNHDYYKGEDKHTEAMMDDFNNMILQGNIMVRQMVHVSTKKEYNEVVERINRYKNCPKYYLSALSGIPIRPYIDLIVINQETVILDFPNDKSAPYNGTFSVAIVDRDIATQFEKYFDIYWNNDCRVIKGIGGVNEQNLKLLEDLSLDKLIDVPEYIDCRELLLKLLVVGADKEEIIDIVKLMFEMSKGNFSEKKKQRLQNKIDSLKQAVVAK